MDAAKVIRMSTNVPKVSYAVKLNSLSVSKPDYNNTCRLTKALA